MIASLVQKELTCLLSGLSEESRSLWAGFLGGTGGADLLGRGGLGLDGMSERFETTDRGVFGGN